MTDDEATLDLGHGEEDSITLEWTPEEGAHGDHTATVSSEGLIESFTHSVDVWVREVYQRSTTGHARRGSGNSSRVVLESSRSTDGFGSGNGSMSRTVEASRSATGSGTASASSSRVLDATRTTTDATGQRGAGSSTRTYDGDRETVATGNGSAATSRSTEASRSASATSMAGVGSASRTLDAERATVAVARPCNASSSSVTVSREAVSVRSTIGWGSGSAIVSWSTPLAWQLPVSNDDGAQILFTPQAVDTDHDLLTLSGAISGSEVDRLEFYHRAGDADRETGAYGTFRRIPRDGREPITITPPTRFSPPFEERSVVPVGFAPVEVAPGRYQATLELGLEQPRPREAAETDGETRLVDSRTVALEHGESQTVTLQWAPGGSDIGLYQATASVENPFSSSSEAVTDVTVTDSEWTLAWPVETLNLTRRDVRQIELESNAGVPQLTLSLKLDAERAAIVLAVGSRVEATQRRSIPDGPNTVVDTLPGAELTCDVDVPEDRDVQSGEYVLASGWNVELAERQSRPFDVTLPLLRKG